MPFLPTVNKKGFMLLDVGANKNCDHIDLINFAKMGQIYSKLIRDIEQPKIGIINIGTEKTKGFDFQQRADKILSEDKNMNYVGYIEPRDLLNGIVDVAVADGYSGNLTLKSLEGGLKALKTVLKKQYKNPLN
jgi:glycerol-3-phosphate acyltransferase PlsX